MRKNFNDLKLLQYRHFCNEKRFPKDFIGGAVTENSYYLFHPAEKRKLIQPHVPIQKKIFPSSIDIPELYLATINNALCFRNQVIIYGNGLLLDSFRHYDYTLPHKNLYLNQKRNRYTVKEKLRKPGFQKGDSIFLCGELSGGYGHFLLEVLSRLWITNYVNIRNFNIVMNPGDKNKWQFDLLKAFGIQKNQIVYLNKPMRFERLHIPVQSFALRKYTSSLATSIWNKVGNFYDQGKGPPKIYVSRSRLKTRRRILINEREVEKVFSSYGFVIVHPQELSVGEQVNLFRHAKIVAGVSGSGMYNCSFQHKMCKKLILTTTNFLKMSDVLINTSTQGSLHYFLGTRLDSQSVNHSNWRVNIKLLNQYLKRFLSL